MVQRKFISDLRLKQTVLLALITAVGVFGSVQAGERPTADDIKVAVSDRTYQGSMTMDAFTEYYHADGKISGKDYSGRWRAMDGKMCFQYGTKPETCWDVEIEDSAMTMFKAGSVDGNGMLIKGNPYNF